MKFKKLFFALIVLILFAGACRTSAPGSVEPQSSSDLFVVVGQSAFGFAGNGSDGLLLDQFSKEKGTDIYVTVADDRDIGIYRSQMLSGQAGAPDVLIVDDSLDIDGLNKIKMIASHKVGVAIRTDVAEALGLQGNTLAYTEFVSMMKEGKLSVVASNALAGSASKEFFFSTMSWCSETDASNLTADIVKLEYVKACGKDVYDYIKSTNGQNAALELVHNAAVAGDPTLSNTLVAFDSDLLGDSGLNAKLMKAGLPVFKFFYFREATAQANVAIGTRNFGENQSKSLVADELISFLISDSSQEAINLAGFSEGSAALVRHIDTAFKPEWGVASNPDVQIVYAPISSVADSAMKVYYNYYKRAKVVEFLIDVSPSTFQYPNGKMTTNVGGTSEEVWRIQAMDIALGQMTNPEWLSANGVAPTPKDEYRYSFFSNTCSVQVTSSLGVDTAPAGERLDHFLGPKTGAWNEPDFYRKTATELEGFQSNGTAIFDCASAALDRIKNDYRNDPDKDYYIVVLTDGEDNGKPPIGNNTYDGNDLFNQWNSFEGKANVSLIGIAFGTDGVSINKDFTAKFGGFTYDGGNDAELLEVLKKILGN